MPQPAARTDFDAVLAAAVEDMLEHGFDSEQRLTDWLRKLRAATASLVPERVLVRQVQDELQKKYAQLVERPAALMKRQAGVSQYTLQMVKPELRAELDRRILASANLIRLNRTESIERTLRRFSGWATSIPMGGTDLQKRKSVAAEVKRGISGLPFEERRVVIDQSAKLVAAVKHVVAKSDGAIGAFWRHVHEGGGYQARPAHVARDGKFFPLRESWAVDKGYLKTRGIEFTVDVEQPGELVFCFPGETLVPFADCVEKAYRRWYSGELAEIVTASGKTLRATPNHPVLTSNGWHAIGALQEGDDVVEVVQDGAVTVTPLEVDVDYAVPSIAQVFDTLDQFGGLYQRSGLRGDFHGDGAEGDVDVVDAARSLTFDTVTSGLQCPDQFNLPDADHFRLCGGSLQQLWKRGLSAAYRFMRCLHSGATFCRGFVFCDQLISELTAAGRSAGFDDMVFDGGAMDPVLLGECKKAYAAFVPLSEQPGIQEDLSPSGHLWPDVNAEYFDAPPQDAFFDVQQFGNFKDRLPFPAKAVEVVNVKRVRFAGHVYNLQTKSGWYVTANIITHNCRCQWEYVYSLADVPREFLSADGRAELDRVTRIIRSA